MQHVCLNYMNTDRCRVGAPPGGPCAAEACRNGGGLQGLNAWHGSVYMNYSYPTGMRAKKFRRAASATVRRRYIFVQPVSVYCSIDCPLSHLAPRAHNVSIDDHIHVTPRDHPTFILTNGLLSTPQIQHINQVTSWPDNTAWFLDHSNKIDIHNISSAMAKRVKSVKSYRTTYSSRFSVGKCAVRPIHLQYILSNLMNKGWSLTMPVRYLVLPNIEISTGQPWSILKYYVSTTVPILN